MKRLRLFSLAAATCLSLWTAQAAADASYPSRSLELVVPFAAGGSTDVAARALAKAAQAELGQSIVVVNKGGAGGAIALDHVLKAKHDGYTLALLTAAGTSVTPFMQKTNYDPLRDFSTVMGFGGYTTYLTVPADSPFKTFQDVVDYAKKNPDQLVVGVTTLGAVNHLGAARLMTERNLVVDYVAFGSGGHIITGLLGGHLQIASVSGEVMPLIKEGKLRALLSFTREPFPDLADVPSIASVGSDWELDNWLGIAVAAGTPEPVRQRLESAFLKAAKDPAFLQTMRDMAMIVSVGDGAQLRKQLETSHADNGRIIRELKLGN